MQAPLARRLRWLAAGRERATQRRAAATTRERPAAAFRSVCKGSAIATCSFIHFLATRTRRRRRRRAAGQLRSSKQSSMRERGAIIRLWMSSVALRLLAMRRRSRLSLVLFRLAILWPALRVGAAGADVDEKQQLILHRPATLAGVGNSARSATKNTCLCVLVSVSLGRVAASQRETSICRLILLPSSSSSAALAWPLSEFSRRRSPKRGFIARASKRGRE